MKINTDIEKIIPPNSECAEYYRQQGISQRTQEILDIIDKIVPYAELDKERWNDLIKELKSQIKSLDKLQKQKEKKA